jgi:hypothetical protein
MKVFWLNEDDWVAAMDEVIKWYMEDRGLTEEEAIDEIKINLNYSFQ